MSSGAVALGLNAVNTSPEDADLLDRQAAAACGQPLLLNAYRQIASEFQLNIAQLLISLEDMETRERYQNTQNTLHRLFEQPVLPIINENDTVATEELRVGDNDRLAAKIAEMIGAQHLVILTSIDGLYDRSPEDPDARFIPELTDVSSYLSVTEGTSALGSGGMKTKMQAANMAQQIGCTTYIGEGVIDAPVSGILENQRRHTRCLSRRGDASSLNTWLSNRLQVTGAIVVDDSAAASLKEQPTTVHRESIVAVHGDFTDGDVVHVFDQTGSELARGLASCSAIELNIVERLTDSAAIDAIDESIGSAVLPASEMVCVEDHHLPWEAPQGTTEEGSRAA
jgi:glutamate 5-kinase